MIADIVKTAIAFFVAAVFQATIVSSVEPGGGSADLVLVTLAAVALLRGSTFGAIAGFYAGFLVDSANLGTLGVTSLLLTLAGYWIGRYGETAGRDSAHAPLLSIAVFTVLYAFGALVLHAMLGEAVSVQSGLRSLPAQILLNLALTVPIFALCRRLFGPSGSRLAVKEVEFS
ncbi:MAG: rod shape-determining protein MreD [Actinobacteria bacterium]|nr:rod shape-determining protein MreD [Actinomycetota bacterium]